MIHFRSLRFRVAFIFAAFGALVSLILAVDIHFATQTLSNRLLDDTLRAELEDYLARRSRNPLSLPPSTLLLVGFVATPPEGQSLPSELLALPITPTPTFANVTLENTPYRSIQVLRGGEAIYLLFNTTPHRERQEAFFHVLLLAAFLMAALAASGGWMIALWITAPVTQLATQVGASNPEEPLPTFASESRRDEVGDLARAFSRHLARLHAFIHRERAFTADVSHELRTPLAVIQGATEVMLSDPALPEKQMIRLERIERSSREMAGLISALLILAREESLSAPSDLECPMIEVVEEVLEKSRPLLQGRKVSLELEVLDTPTLVAARILAGVVVSNLIRNAIHHTREGQVAVQLHSDRLVVTDTGEGIPKENLKHIFKHYYRGGTSTGYGIGLSLVRRICDLYAWDILLDSVPGQGTTAQLLFLSHPNPSPS